MIVIAKHKSTGRYHIIPNNNDPDLWSSKIRKSMCGSVGLFNELTHRSIIVSRILRAGSLCGECRTIYNDQAKQKKSLEERKIFMVVNFFCWFIYAPKQDNVITLNPLLDSVINHLTSFSKRRSMS